MLVNSFAFSTVLEQLMYCNSHVFVDVCYLGEKGKEWGNIEVVYLCVCVCCIYIYMCVCVWTVV